MRIKEKKRGSALVTVLAFSIVLLMLGGAILTSVMGTMKANRHQKEQEDLKYAAQSGLEIARSYLSGKSTITKEDINNINNQLKNILVDKNIGKVELVSPIVDGTGKLTNQIEEGAPKAKTGEIIVRVKAEKKGNPEKKEFAGVGYSVLSGGNGSIFKYGLVSGSGGINIEAVAGSTSMGTTNIAGPSDKINIPDLALKPGKEEKDYSDIVFSKTGYTEEIIVGSLVNGMIDGIKYEDLSEDSDKHMIKNYKYYDVKTRKQLEVDDIQFKFGDQFVKFNGEKITLDQLKTKSKKSIIRVTAYRGSGDYAVKLNLVNTKKITFDLKSKTLHLFRESVIAQGEINMLGKGTLSIQFGTIFANKIYISKESSITIDYQTAKIPVDVGHGAINVKEEKELNMILNSFIPNWNLEDGIGGSNMEFKGGFSN